MIHLVNFADFRMTKAQELCCVSGLKYGVDEVTDWSAGKLPVWLQDFNYDIFKHDRGVGYWLWKPFIIYHKMLGCKDNDILIYADSGVEFIAPVKEIIDRMDEDIFLFTNGWPHVEWCKMDVMKEILGCDMNINIIKVPTTVKQCQASVIFFRVNQKTKDFVKEWLLYSQMPGFIDDSPSKLPNYPTFAEHRHDQAILTCVAIKHGYTIDHWWPTQYSHHLPRKERDNYPVLFNHHRRRNEEW